MALLPDGPIDTLGYLDTALDSASRVAAAADADPIHGLPLATDIDNVAITAPGQLDAAGVLVEAVAAHVVRIPVLPVGSQLPAWVSSRTLVIAVDGAEADTAAQRGAHTVSLPVDTPQVVRLGVPEVVVRVLRVLEQLGLYAEIDQSAGAAVEQLRRRSGELAADDNSARRLARRVGRTLPIVYGTDVLGGAAALWWKTQVNASAKAASFANALPALGEAEIAGWGQHGDMTRQVFSLVVLRHDHEPAGVDDQVRHLDDLLDEVVHERHVVEAEGNGSLAQLLDLVLYGDVFAYHLAQELEIDPGPVAASSRP